jgi:hypothetical protein
MTHLKATEIAALNDLFRSGFYIPSFGPRPVPGRVVCTSGIAVLPPETQILIWAEVSSFDRFTEDNDPHGERDFGAFDVEDIGEVCWKIDYYADNSCSFGSEDPSDTSQCFRVLTIMLASEY